MMTIFSVNACEEGKPQIHIAESRNEAKRKQESDSSMIADAILTDGYGEAKDSARYREWFPFLKQLVKQYVCRVDGNRITLETNQIETLIVLGLIPPIG